MSIGLNHLRAFSAVAEELHFGRAARRLEMNQPALSRMIKVLEGAVGAPLFRRTTRNVALTDAGHAFLADARAAIRHAEQAVLSARQAAAGQIGRLTVTYMDFAINGELPAILKRFRRSHPGIHVELTYMPTAHQRTALMEGRADAAFLIGPMKGRDVDTIAVTREPFCVVLPDSHDLAGERAIRLDQLAGEPFVLGDEAGWSAFRRIFLEMCAGAGFVPNVVQEASTSDGIIGLVAANMGITVYPACARSLLRAPLVLRPLDDVRRRVETVFAWRRPAVPALTQFITTVQAYVAERERAA